MTLPNRFIKYLLTVSLAILRGFLEGYLRMSIAPAEEDALEMIENQFIKASLNNSVEQVKRAIRDGYRRMLQPSLETEFRNALKQKADEEAITCFCRKSKTVVA